MFFYYLYIYIFNTKKYIYEYIYIRNMFIKKIILTKKPLSLNGRINGSLAIVIPKQEVLLNKNTTYKFEIDIHEV